MKLSKPLIILLSIYVLIGTYFLTGVVDIALNGKILKLSKYYNASFTFKGLINGYPKIYESLAISFAICVAFIAIFLLLPKKIVIKKAAITTIREDVELKFSHIKIIGKIRRIPKDFTTCLSIFIYLIFKLLNNCKSCKKSLFFFQKKLHTAKEGIIALPLLS